MSYEFILGIDISKRTFDFCLTDGEGFPLNQGRVDNERGEIREWAEVLGEDYGGEGFWSSCLVCLEHSGYYSAPLLEVLGSVTGADIWVESALRIKRSAGLQRGKSDRMDAGRIASYALVNQRAAQLWQPPSAEMERLGLLLSHRDRAVKYLMAMRNTSREEEGFVGCGLQSELAALEAPAMESLEGLVEKYDKLILELLKGDEGLSRQSEIVRSIPGFGPVIAPKLIAETHGFTRLTDPRSFACHAGIAPFEHSSGTSVRGRTRVSHIANKEMKKMLHMAALVTIRKGNIMHAYYVRKVSEGKNRMSVINAVRNKLVHILMACIRNDVMYQKNYKQSLG